MSYSFHDPKYQKKYQNHEQLLEYSFSVAVILLPGCSAKCDITPGEDTYLFEDTFTAYHSMSCVDKLFSFVWHSFCYSAHEFCKHCEHTWKYANMPCSTPSPFRSLYNTANHSTAIVQAKYTLNLQKTPYNLHSPASDVVCIAKVLGQKTDRMIIWPHNAPWFRRWEMYRFPHSFFRSVS